MYTLNLAIVFEQGPVIMLACSSGKPLDAKKINEVSTKYFKGAILINASIANAIELMVRGIKKECNCECFQLVADAYVTFSKNNNQEDILC